MEWSVGLSPVFLLWLLLWEPAASRCARSLVYKFTVTPKGHPWCEIEGQANGNTFLHYTCGSNKVKPITVREINATQAWNQHRDTLLYMVEELRKTLLNNKAKFPATSHPLSLQGSMMYKEESSGPTSASIEFGLDGKISLYLDSKKENWTVLHDEGRLLNKTFSSDKDMTHLLVKTSAGDCKKWLEQVLCLQDEILNTTAASPTATATVPPKANMPIVLILSIIFICLFIICILSWGLNRLLKRCDQGGPGGVDKLSDSAFPLAELSGSPAAHFQNTSSNPPSRD